MRYYVRNILKINKNIRNFATMIKDFYNADLFERNSFHVNQRAAQLVEFDKAEDLFEIFAQGEPEQWTLLAGGNNVLFTKDYEGVIITPRECLIEPIAEDNSSVEVRVTAGVEWDDLVEWCACRELWGIENLSLIPGKVGAAPVQNIGAYGAEAKDCITSVEVFMVAERKMVEISAEECRFGYRESIFKHELKGRAIITAVRFRFSKVPKPNIAYGDLAREVELRGGVSLRNIRDAVCAIRRSKLPDTAILGNAGSFFKNPIVERSVADGLKAEYEDMPIYPTFDESRVKLAAGWLIDRAGMKGYKEQRVGVHERQALVLVNLGGATGGDVMALARKVQQRVKEQFGIEINTEVNVL